MKCPKCGHERGSAKECGRCGIIFEKYRLRQEQLNEQNNEPSPPKLQGGMKGVWVGLAIGLLVGMGVFYFLSKPPSTPQPIPETQNKVAKQQFPPAQTSLQPRQDQPPAPRQQSDEELTGIALQLSESHPPSNGVEEARNATVFIKTSWGSGSGFFIDPVGHIVTNRHVVEFGRENLAKAKADLARLEKSLRMVQKNIRYLKKQALKVGSDVREQVLYEIKRQEEEYAHYKALQEQVQKRLEDIERTTPVRDVKVVLIDGTELEVLGIDLSPNLDLALLTISASQTPFVKIAAMSNGIAQGAKVYTIGNPAGLRHTVTSGIISGYRTYRGSDVIQTDAPINPGNSGGPLVDESGRVLGVNTMVIKDTEGLGFAIPMKQVKEEFGYQLGN